MVQKHGKRRLPARVVLERTCLCERSKRLLAEIRRAGEHRANVLLLGETGVGKEVVSQALHDWFKSSSQATASSRGGAFVAVHLAAIPEALRQAELTGWARGAFSGASDDYEGKIKAADGGTLLLDEIAACPRDAQLALLRVVNDHVVQPLGKKESTEVDVRLIAATNRDLVSECRAGRFLTDLYYRLAVVKIEVPPLRERLDDIPVLVELLLETLTATHGRPAVSLARGAMDKLLSHSWPGNIRELENVLEQAILLVNAVNSNASAKLEPEHFNFDSDLPYPEQMAALAIIKDKDDRLLVVDSSWQMLFFPSARFPHPGVGNLRAALVDRLRAELELVIDSDYELDDARLDVDLMQPSRREGVNKFYHFGLYRLRWLRSGAELQTRVAARARCGWIALDNQRIVGMSAPISPTVSRILDSRHDGISVRDWLKSWPPSFESSVGTEQSVRYPSPPTAGVAASSKETNAAQSSDWRPILTWDEEQENLRSVYFPRLMEAAQGNISAAAKLAGMARNNLRPHLDRLGITPSRAARSSTRVGDPLASPKRHSRSGRKVKI